MCKNINTSAISFFRHFSRLRTSTCARFGHWVKIENGRLLLSNHYRRDADSRARVRALGRAARDASPRAGARVCVSRSEEYLWRVRERFAFSVLTKLTTTLACENVILSTFPGIQLVNASVATCTARKVPLLFSVFRLGIASSSVCQTSLPFQRSGERTERNLLCQII